MEKIDMAIRVKELNRASDAYYNTGAPIMSDAEFDKKLEELKKWEDEMGISLANSPTKNVGFKVLDGIKEVEHKTPMLSLEKCHSVEEIVKFANRHNLVASVKLDGLTVRLTYKNGDLVLAESRGNGIVGSDVTEHVKQFTNVPLHINKEGIYVIDGEALIKLDDFTVINKNGEYKNSRNLAAGTLSSLDTSVVKQRKISWYAWEVVENDATINSFFETLFEASLLGFNVVPFNDIAVENFGFLQDYIDSFIKIAEEKNLPQDGVVFKFDDISYGKSLGNTSHHYRNGIAYKIYNDSIETELLDIEWTMGKTGSLCPTAVFKPVEIEGTTVERASLHNISVMKNIMGETWKGQKIGVYKSNLIIPQVRWAEQVKPYNTEMINIPSICPICGNPTKIVKDNDSEVLYCTNENCKGRLLGKLTHAVSKSALNVDGLSESTIEKFINLGWLSSIQDIYHLSDHEKEMKSLEGFGKKSVEKLLSSIEKSRSTALDRFLYSLSIPLLGKSTSKDIAKACKYNFYAFVGALQACGRDAFTYIDGIGEALGRSIIGYWNKHGSEILDLSEEFIFDSKTDIKSNRSLEGLVFVITGSVNHYKNRDELKTNIESHGGKVSGSISAKTNYLINNDINSNSSKNQKAKSLNIPIISEDDFIKMLE